MVRDDAYERRRALLAVGVAAFMAIMCVAVAPVLVVAMGRPHGITAGLNTLLVAALSGVTLPVVRRTGSLVFAGNWLALLLFVGVGYSLLGGGGVLAPFMSAMLVCPVLALVISGRGSGYVWIGICAGLIASVHLSARLGAEFPNLLSASVYTDMMALMYVVVLVLLTMIAAFSESTTEIAIDDVARTAGRLGDARLAEEHVRGVVHQTLSGAGA